MNSVTVINSRIAPGSTVKPRILDSLARKAVLRRLADLRHGELTLLDGPQEYRFGQPTELCNLSVRVTVRDQRFYSDIAFAGTIGAGEAYMCNYWETNDLTALIRIFAVNRRVQDDMEGGLALITAPLQKILHWFNRNTRRGSRKNIAAHYDLGNELFRIMLDETMMYSSAIFAHGEMPLHEAQINRMDIICKKLDLKPSDHLLEIGTGWGGFSMHAARNYGCRVVTTTISREQYEFARQRVREEGLSDRITVLLKDYRELSGQYDKLVSIEMIEAVGHHYYETYFRKCSELLKDDGMMFLQAITIADQRYESARKSVDFIKRYIFPGSCIPSNTSILEAVTKASDLRLFSLTDIGPHYATTLRRWRENFFAGINQIKGLGYGEEFIRMWKFYLCYCEGGFTERVISNAHMLLVKPGNRCAHLN